MSRRFEPALRLAFTAALLVALAPRSHAEEGVSHEPTVTKGRQADEPYGPPPPPEFTGHANDDPDARNAWFVRQRTYPFNRVPDDAYDDAAREYLRRRELIEELDLQSLAAGSPVPLGPLPTGPWSEVGPAPISPSGFAFGNVVGRISAVAVHPTNGSVLLVGASRGGLWRTTNNGGAWTPVGDNQNTLAIADVKFAPSNPSIVYAGTGDDDIGFWGAGVLKSTDGGVTWARIDNGTAANGIVNGTILSKIVVDPTNANVVTTAGYYQADPSGSNFYSFVFHTTDGGATWSKATIPSGGNQAQFRSLVIEPNCPTNLWALNFRDHTVNRSVNGGVTWTATASAGLPAFTGNTQLAVQHASCAGSATVYASVYSQASYPPAPVSNNLAGTVNYPGFFRSTDNGATFSRPGAAGPSGGCLFQCEYDHFLLVDPSDAARVYMIGRDLWTSTDSGATWTNRSAGFDDANNYFGGNMHVDLHDLAIRGTGAAAVIYVASDGGLWSYDVTANAFTNRVGNLAISEFIDLAVDPDTPNRAIGGLQDNGTIVYTGASAWPARLGGDGGPGGYLRVTPGAGNPFDGAFTTYVGNVGYRSTNSGTSFSGWANDASFNNEAAEFYGPWVPTLGNNRVWHAAQSLWYCDFPNACSPWSSFAPTNIAGLTGSAFVSKLAINNTTSGVFGPFYAANAYPRAFLQSNDGVTWNIRTGVLPDRYVSRIEFDPAAPAKVWVTLQGFGTGHVWYSPDGGTTWVNKSGSLPNVPVNSILLDPEDRANVWYVATDTGVYGTINGSAVSPTWTVVGTGLPAVMVADLELDQNRVLYAATGGRSVWKIGLQSSCATVGNNGPLCAGAALNLTASTVAGATYAWTGPNGFSSPAQNPSIPNATIAASGTYTLTTTLNATTCVATTTVAVNPVPPAPAAANNGPVCEGTTLDLAASPLPGATYTWTGPNGFTSSSQNPSIPNAPAAASGDYTVAATVNGCTSAVTTTTATVISGSCNDGNACTAGDTCGITPPNPVENFDEATAPAIPAGWAWASTDTPWMTTSAFALSAPNSVTTDTPPYTSDKALDSPSFIQGAGAVLEFDNRYNLEPTYDGAVLEIKIGGGAFTDIVTAGGTFLTGGYNMTIDTCCGNPIAARPAWSSSSAGFVHTVVNLPPAAVGQAVVLRWRVASDGSVAPAPPNGQWIDNVRVTYGPGCLPGAPVDCNDGNACTNDSCDPGIGCINAVNDISRFASSVVAFSSQYSPTDYSAQQALGPPNVYPAYGDIPLAWSSLAPDSPGEFLDLAFDDPAPISFVNVYEIFHPGSISSISVMDPNTSMFEVVWAGAAAPAPPVSRVFTVTFPLTSFPVSEIRIDFDSPAVPGWSDVDAVAIGVGSACEDGDGCTVGDRCSDGVCTSGTPITAPPEIQSLKFAADKSTMTWLPATYATSYDAVAGIIGALPVGPGGGDEACAGGLPGPAVGTASPGPGIKWWFLSRGVNACGAGTYGTQGIHGAPGAPRVTTSCP